MGPAAIAEGDLRADELRGAVGRLLGAPADEVALTRNTTDGLNAVIWGIDWREGDEAVTTSLEHPGLAVPLRVMARRRGVRLQVLELGDGAEDLEPLVAAVCGPRTRLVALSHAAYTTGARMDVAGAARAAGAVGALVAVDGAQGVGAIPTDPRALGVDAYALPSQKWLLGPEGLGALWIRPEAMERVDLTFSGFDSAAENRADLTHVPHAGARRFEVSTLPVPLVPGWLAALDWLDGLGWDWIHARVAEMTAAARERLAALPGVRVLTPPGEQAGLVAFTVEGVVPSEGSKALAARGVTVRWVPHPAALRISTGFFTDEADLDRLVDGVSALRRLIPSAP
jgi:L-cysteine/cystine lyase